MSSGNKPLPRPMLAQMYVASLSHNKFNKSSPIPFLTGILKFYVECHLCNRILRPQVCFMFSCYTLYYDMANFILATWLYNELLTQLALVASFPWQLSRQVHIVSVWVNWNLPLLGLQLYATSALTHWGWDKMDTISQTTFSSALFFKENVWISIKSSLKFVAKSPINNIPGLV